MSNFLGSSKVRAVLWILGGLIVFLVAFGAGVSVGYQRAGFAAGFERNYYPIFFGDPRGVAMQSGTPEMTPVPMPASIHGVVGTIIDLGTSTISVKDQRGNEQSVLVSTGTDIRDGDGDVLITSLAVGDTIAVIGGPNDMGQVDARFIRVLAASSSTPMQ
jgi:hypothetical protein